MARDGSGNYNLAAAYPFVANTVISSADMNNVLADVATALTDSLPRDGQAGMTGPFRLADGTTSAPSFAFNSEASTGLYRPGTNILGFAVGAGERMRLLSNGNAIIGSTSDSGERLQVAGTARITGLLTVNANINTPSTGRIGYLADSDTGTIQGVTSAHYGLTLGGSHTGLGGGGALLSGYYGIILATTGTERLRISSTGAVTIGGTLGVTGATTLAALSATTGTFSGNVTSANLSATPGVADRIVRADSNGYILNNYFHSSDNSQASGVSAIMVKAGDNYLRSGTAAAVRTFLDSPTLGSNNAFRGSNNSFGSVSGQGVGYGGSSGFEAYGQGGGAAFMSFHRPGSYAVNMGLDTDNTFKIGGWSDGAAYRAQFFTGGSLRIRGALYCNDGSKYIQESQGSYGTFEVSGANAGYAGIRLINGGDVVTGMYDASGNGGDWSPASGWHFFWNRSHGCLGIGGSTTASSYKAYTNGSHYVGGSLAVNGSSSATAGDITTSRAGGTTGVLYFGTSASKYLYYDGTNFSMNGGSLTVTGDITAYSDIRIKTDIEQITGALDKVDQIRGVTFLKTNESNNKRFTGVIAQEVQKVLPEAVSVGSNSPNADEADGLLTVAYGNMVGLLVEAIKELRAEVNALKAKAA